MDMQQLLSFVDTSLVRPLTPPKKTTPTLLESNDKANLWFFHDTSFKLPENFGVILIDKPGVLASARNILYMELLCNMINSAAEDEICQLTQRGLMIVTVFFRGELFNMRASKMLKIFEHIRALKKSEIPEIVEILKLS